MTDPGRSVGAWLSCCTVLFACGLDQRKFSGGSGVGGPDASLVGGGRDRAADAGGWIGAPRLELNTTVVDLGPVAIGYPSRARITAANAGDAPLPVPEVTWADGSDADFTVAQNQCLEAVAPGERCELRVQFLPSKEGAVAATLRVAGAGTALDVALAGRGLVAGDLLVVPAEGSFENFGKVLVGASADGLFTLLNPTAAPSGPLSFTVNDPAFTVAAPSEGAASTASSTAAPPCTVGASLPAGESCALRIGFTPSARGPIDATLTGTSEVAGSVSTTLLGEGIVAGLLAASVSELNFEGVIPGDAARRTLAVENAGDEPLTLSGVGLVPADASAFSIVNGTCSADLVLRAAESCNLELEFRPTLSDVASEAELVVTALEGNQNQHVSLKGVGLKPGSIEIAAPAPGDEDFGDVVIGENLVRVFRVTNPGAQASGVLTLTASNGFSVEPPAEEGDCQPDTTLVDGASCAVRVRFAPTERGAAAGTLTMSSELAGASSFDLIGNGLAPAALELTADEVNFGRLTTGETAQNMVSVSNTGDQPLPPPTFEVVSPDRAQAAAFTFESRCSAPLAFGESCDIALSFAPTLAKAHSATLEMVADPGGRASVLLLGQAVTPGSLVLAAEGTGGADFGDVPLGATGTKSFTLTNPGGEPAGVVTIRSDNTVFAVRPGNCNEDPAGLVDGASCTFDVVFTPKDATPAVGRLLALSGPLGEVSVELKGRGRAPATLEAATTTRDLGQANVGEDPKPANQFTWTVNNTGDLPSGTLTVASTNGTEFEVSNDTCSDAQIAPRASCQVLIGFRPGEPGIRRGTITITDVQSRRSLSLALSGSGQRIVGLGEPCVGAVCAEGFCTAGVCCDRECERACEICSAAGECTEQRNQEVCGTGAERCFGVEQCRLPTGAGCTVDADCGGGAVCKSCLTGGKQCTAPTDCCGGCPDDQTCSSTGSCVCAGTVCGDRCLPAGSCCPGSTDMCAAPTPFCNDQGRCVACLGDGSCGECERCDTVAGTCGNTPRGERGRCDPPDIAVCDGLGNCTIPQCIPGTPSCPECQTCDDFSCVPQRPEPPASPDSVIPCSTGVCNPENGICQQCVSEAQCATCETCDFGSCVPIPPGQSSTRCGAGEICDENGQCLAPACVEGEICDQCNRCVLGRCQPITGDIPCGGIEAGTCLDGVCVRCLIDSNCTPCEFCQQTSHTCEPLPAGDPGRCSASLLDPPQSCDGNGACIPCLDDLDCANPGETCDTATGTCLPPAQPVIDTAAPRRL